ncbi:NUDIX domain-containing protein [Dokdonia ponticola]|uniref:NUDIX domain-containing protein n=1 Tax=Dokdonia ponticola TaxID=2041041 RepID=A0ABV9HYB9_9FLAO
MTKYKPIHKSRLIAFKEDRILVLEKVGARKKYTLAGGVQKKGESDYKSLIRETSEEIGVTLKKKHLTYFISIKNVTKDKKIVFKHYFITTKSIVNIEVLEPEKFKKALWMPWYQALEFLDKEDRSAVVLYCDQFRQEAN